MIRVKICGITRLEDALFAVEKGAWALGFIFAPESPRRIEAETARAIIEKTRHGDPLFVGVFMDQGEEEIKKLADTAGIDIIQLHGSEPPELCAALKPRHIIKAVTGGLAKAAEHPADYLLIDRPRTAKEPQAETADLAFAGKLAQRRGKTILAGGLTPENVEAALRRVRPWGVDVAEGVETEPGIKDEDLIHEFFTAVRRATEPKGSEVPPPDTVGRRPEEEQH